MNVPFPITPCSAAGVSANGWTTGPGEPFGAMWMCAAVMVPGMLFATSLYEPAADDQHAQLAILGEPRHRHVQRLRPGHRDLGRLQAGQAEPV